MDGRSEDGISSPKAGAVRSMLPFDEQQTMFHILRDRADQFPDHLAVEDSEHALTYRELALRVEHFAYLLVDRGLEAGSAVVLYLERSTDFVVALFALWRVGAIAVPVDRVTPKQRLVELLNDCAASLVVGQKGADLSGVQISILLMDLEYNSDAISPSERPLATVTAARAACCLYTSGSTGRPKGVLISHRSVACYAIGCVPRLGLTHNDRCMQVCSVGFDGAMHEICTAIAAGACIVIYPCGDDVSTVALDEFINKANVSALLLPTALWRIWVTEHAWAGESLPSCLRLVMTGGEKIERSDFRAWRSLDAAGAPTLINIYGPTEATISATLWIYNIGDPFPENGEVPIGSPNDGYHCHIVDDRLNPVPNGEVGQLAIGGPGVAIGYLNRPAETAASFVPDPFRPSTEERLYLTGDRVRMNEQGLFEFIGRTDAQIKVLGHRVEIDEVECAMRDHPGISDAVVVVCDTGEGKHLAAFCQPKPGINMDSVQVREWLSARKPYYIVPRLIEMVDAFPITINGKVDRQALAERAERAEVAASDVASVALRHKVAAIWKLTLGVESVAEKDNFFDCGGHSLLLARLIWAVREATGVELAYGDIFANPTFSGILSLVQNNAEEDSTVTPLNLYEAGADEAGANDHQWIPVTYQQRRLLNQAHEDFATAIRVVPIMLEFSGSVDLPRLQRALENTINRHAVFHTRFKHTSHGVWKQMVNPVGRIDIERGTIHPDGGDAAELRNAAGAIGSKWAFRGMDILNGELVRARILTSNTARTWLVIAFHHIVIDAQSISIFINELVGLYTRDTPSGPVETLYLQYAKEQAERMESGAYARDLNFWAEYLRGAEPVLLPRAPNGQSGTLEAPCWHAETISTELLRQIRARATAEGTTVFTLCLVALILVLAEVTGQDDIVVGVPHHNRPSPKYRNCVGYFVNSIPVRAQLSGYNSVRSLLASVQSHLETAPLRLGVSMADVDLPAKEGYSRPFQAMMVDEHVRSYSGMRGVSIAPVKLAAPFTKGDLNLLLTEEGDLLRFGFVFDPALLPDAEVATWLEKFIALIDHLAKAQGGLANLGVSTALQGLRNFGDG